MQALWSLDVVVERLRVEIKRIELFSLGYFRVNVALIAVYRLTHNRSTPHRCLLEYCWDPHLATAAPEV